MPLFSYHYHSTTLPIYFVIYEGKIITNRIGSDMEEEDCNMYSYKNPRLIYTKLESYWKF